MGKSWSVVERADVLLLTPTGAPGGAERALAGLARNLPAHGFSVAAVSLEAGPAVEWLDAVCPVTVIPAGRLRNLARAALTVRRLRMLIRELGARVVVSNQGKGHLYGGWAARRAGVPAVYWNHVIPEPDRLNRLAARVPARVIVCTTELAAAAQRRLTPRATVAVIPPGIDVVGVSARRGSGVTLRRDLGWGDEQVVGIVGRLQAWKGQDVFLDAAARLSADLPSASFAVVGGAVLGWEGDEEGRLKARAADFGIADRVHFAGHQDDPYPWIDALDVLVHASTLPEPFGLVLVEAMALGTPVVATAAGGPLEIVEDGVSGLLVPPGDASAMAGAVRRILGDSALAAGLAAAGRQRAGAFSERAMAERFAAVLAQAIES